MNANNSNDKDSKDDNVPIVFQNASSQRGNVNQVGRDYTYTRSNNFTLWMPVVLISIFLIGGLGWLLGLRVSLGENGGIEIQIQNPSEGQENK